MVSLLLGLFQSLWSLGRVWLCDPMDRSTPGCPIHHQLLELVHRVGDAIQPSHPLLSPSSAFSLSQQQVLFQWVSSSLQVAKVLELQHQSFQWIFSQDWFLLGLTSLILLQSKGLSRVFSSTIVQKHRFFSAQLSLWFRSHYPFMTTRKTIALTRWTFVGKVMSFVCVCGEGVGLDCLFNFIYFKQMPPFFKILFW